jgi:hypothetical protein
VQASDPRHFFSVHPIYGSESLKTLWKKCGLLSGPGFLLSVASNGAWQALQVHTPNSAFLSFCPAFFDSHPPPAALSPAISSNPKLLGSSFDPTILQSIVLWNFENQFLTSTFVC